MTGCFSYHAFHARSIKMNANCLTVWIKLVRNVWLAKQTESNYTTGCVCHAWPNQKLLINAWLTADGKRKQTDKSDCKLDQTSQAMKLRKHSLVYLTVWTWLAEQCKSKWLAVLSCLSRLIMRKKCSLTEWLLIEN